jgi:hypothetical protein
MFFLLFFFDDRRMNSARIREAQKYGSSGFGSGSATLLETLLYFKGTALLDSIGLKLLSLDMPS